MRFELALLIPISMLTLTVSACGGGEVTPQAPTTSSVKTLTSTDATPPPPPTTIAVAPPETPAPPAPEPTPATIVGCQSGYDPVTTTWSDGTVTGYSNYCQSVRDEFLQEQVVQESGPTQYVCESGYACGITESDGVMCDETGCHAI
ncbi:MULTISPECIES: hypothetical protein [unclassified Rhodococcus (in: high G+C Gram-positive bacteria)]|uniref:hypothetical protein n=1 Tax=unclassified Rhodococcus (in: high G+C Gram-positive bacteria) TaxID=192944 RepID=UPI000B0C0E11|nr:MULTISPECIES: hypothetical protein [unclassified Rhodococcus (in: high G+C Gram-positive bacteria)]